MKDELVTVETGSSPTRCVIWLHGLGADGYDFVPVVRELEHLGVDNVRYIFPHAPPRPVSINGGYVMRAWYDIKHVDLVRMEDESGIRSSGDYVEKLLDSQIGQGISPSSIILAGFSQGGAIAYFQGLRSKHKLAGIVALSTYLPLIEQTEIEKNPNNNDVPIFAGHGVNDEIVLESRGLLAVETLRKQGHQVEYKSYSMDHSVCGEELADIANFLKSKLK